MSIIHHRVGFNEADFQLGVSSAEIYWSLLLKLNVPQIFHLVSNSLAFVKLANPIYH